MANVAVRDVQEEFTDVKPSDVDALVRQLVHRRYEAARVKTFVGVLAEREARAEIKRQLGSHSRPEASFRG